ncbi:MAG: hypothetical protein QM733_11645 [Ilumatobacteraceae bacterium]
MRAAAAALDGGEPPGSVARRIGYKTASGFSAAHRREHGTTPSARR